MREEETNVAGNSGNRYHTVAGHRDVSTARYQNFRLTIFVITRL